MNPLTVAGQGAAALAVLIALRIAGDPLAAAIVGGTLFATGVIFQLFFWPKSSPEGKRWPARLFASLPTATFVLLGSVPFVLLLTAHRASSKHPLMHHSRPVAGILLAFACGAACVFASSLVDAYVVSPRLRGDRGRRPCQEAKDAAWRPLTQLWLLHRILAYLAVRSSLAAAVVIVVVASIHRPSTAVTSAIVAVSSLVAGYLLNRATPIFISAINPPFYVGDKVWLVEEYAAGDKPQTCYYAVDVSIDGVGLLELDSDQIHDREPSQSADAGSDRTHDRIVAIADMGRLLRSRRVFTACGEGDCRMVNKYCPIAQRRRQHQSDEATEPRPEIQEPQPPAGVPDV